MLAQKNYKNNAKAVMNGKVTIDTFYMIKLKNLILK